MLNQQDARDAIGQDLYSSDGEKIGRIGQVYLDDETDRPEFVTVHTGLFGTNESFVPLAEASMSDGHLTVPFDKGRVKDAPNISLDDGHLSQAQERELYSYYGMGYSDAMSDTGLPAGGMDAAGQDRTSGQEMDLTAEGEDTSGPTTDDAMTRSEERARVGTTTEEGGRVRLRKYVVTEEETHTVPVRKEKAVLETEPITDANAGDALDGPEISEEVHEVTLHEERPVVEKVTEPVERVRLGTEEVTSEETVSTEVRKEQIEAEGDVDQR